MYALKAVLRVFRAMLGIWAAGCFSQQACAVATFVVQNHGIALVYDAEGGLLFGDQYVARLYGAATTNALAPARRSLSGEALLPPAPFRAPGEFASAGAAYVESDAPCGGYSWLQVRVWDTRLGPSYEDVAALGIGGYGESNLFWAPGGYICLLPDPPARLVGLESFSLRPVLHLEAREMRAEAFGVAVHGPAGLEVVVERSTNLVDWVDWQALTLGDLPTELSDTNAPSCPQTFYRARKAP